MSGASRGRHLHSGDLSAELVGTDLRSLAWRGVEVLDRLYGSVRDEGWRTVPGGVRDLVVDQEVDGFLLEFTVDHQDQGMPFVWTATIEGRNNTLTATFDGWAQDDLAANRIGWCLLHPLSQIGGCVRHALDGITRNFTLPFRVAPQPLGANGGVQPAWGPFDTLILAAHGVESHIQFAGDLFEMEDQRNWTDASFKTYSTPLSEPRPRRLTAGERMHQRVEFSFSPGSTPEEPVRTCPHRRGTTRLTAVVDRPDIAICDVLEVLAVVDGLRAEVAADTPDECVAAARTITLARRAPVWELSVLATADTAWETLNEIVAEGPAPTVALILPRTPQSGELDECTSPELAARARARLSALDPATIGGGTRHNFCELQRHDLTHLPVVGCTYSPRVHTSDAPSIRETLRSYEEIVATVRQAVPDADFLIGPLRDPEGLPTGWVADSVGAWSVAGADGICVAALPVLVCDGRLTNIGASLGVLRTRR